MSYRKLARTSQMIVLLIAILGMTSVSFAQGRGGRGGRGGTRGMISGTQLLGIKVVQEELELDEEQLEELAAIDTGRGRGRGGRGGGTGGGDAAERPNFREMSDEERTAYFDEQRKASEERRSAATAKVEEILLPHQVTRLEQIRIQLSGIQALSDPKVAEELELSDEDKEEMKKVVDDQSTEMRELFRGGGDREDIRAKMTEMREKTETAVLATLNSEQKSEFEELKGEPISFSRDELMAELRGGRGGRGGTGGGRGGATGGRGGRRAQGGDAAPDA